MKKITNKITNSDKILKILFNEDEADACLLTKVFLDE